MRKADAEFYDFCEWGSVCWILIFLKCSPCFTGTIIPFRRGWDGVDSNIKEGQSLEDAFNTMCPFLNLREQLNSFNKIKCAKLCELLSTTHIPLGPELVCDSYI